MAVRLGRTCTSYTWEDPSEALEEKTPALNKIGMISLCSWEPELHGKEPMLTSSVRTREEADRLYPSLKKILPLAGIVYYKGCDYEDRMGSEYNEREKPRYNYAWFVTPILTSQITIDAPKEDELIDCYWHTKKPLKDLTPQGKTLIDLQRFVPGSWKVGVQDIYTGPRKRLRQTVYLSERIKATEAEALYSSVKKVNDTAGIIYYRYNESGKLYQNGYRAVIVIPDSEYSFPY